MCHPDGAELKFRRTASRSPVRAQPRCPVGSFILLRLRRPAWRKLLSQGGACWQVANGGHAIRQARLRCAWSSDGSFGRPAGMPAPPYQKGDGSGSVMAGCKLRCFKLCICRDTCRGLRSTWSSYNRFISHLGSSVKRRPQTVDRPDALINRGSAASHQKVAGAPLFGSFLH